MGRKPRERDARGLLLFELRKRKQDGIYQHEFEVLSGFSKSHISETLSDMESEGRIIREVTSGPANRIWLPRYYPRYTEGSIRIGLLRSTEYFRAVLAINSYCRRKHIRADFYMYDGVSALLDDQCHGTIEISMAPVVAQLMFAFTRNNIFLCDFIASSGSALLANEKSVGNLLATTEPSSMLLLAREAPHGITEVVSYRYEDPCLAMKGFRKGKFRRLAIWEPYVTELKRTGDFAQILSYGELLGSLPCCSVAVSESFSSEGSTCVREIVEEIGRWRDRELSDFDFSTARKLIRTRCVSPESFDESIGHYDFKVKFDRETLVAYLEKAKLPFTYEAIKERLLI